jgi:signal transduction histidine kinase
MKLVTKTILYYLLVSIPLLLIAALISYFTINRAVNDNLNEIIWNKKRQAETLIDQFNEPKDLCLSFDSLASITIDTTNGKGYKYSYLFKMDPEDGEQVEYWALKSYYKSKGTNYLITIIEPKFEKDDLIESLLSIFFIMLAFLVAGFFAVNWIVSKLLWKPFRETVSQLSQYEIKNHTLLDLKPTTTNEFKQLNEAVKNMTEKIQKDFLAQKEFTENASHETQTPLAVIKARIDLLLQSPNLKEEEMKQLEIIEQAVNKLSSLNRALLLLAKIENNQFKDLEEVDIETVLNKTLAIYEDLIDSKKITINKKINGPGIIKADPVLVDILISNLIQNAVRHNEEGGKIDIELYSHSLSIANTGKPLAIETEKLFERFRKNEGSKESIGLGLAIVKSILETYNYKFDYSFTDNRHTFIIEF